MAAEPTRRLSLRTETLSELSPADLASIRGAQIYTPIINTMPLKNCIYSDQCWYTEACNSGANCDPW